MGKPRTPNQKKAYAALKGRLNQYSYMVQSIYDTLNAEAAKLALSTGYAGEREFRWSDYPQTKKRIDALQGRFCDDITGVIYAGTEKEWMESNIVQDMLVTKAMKTYHVESKGKKYQKLYNQTNQDALKAFQERVDGGMNLSSNVWNQSVAYRRELECAISAGVEKGMSAVTLSKRLSQYLTDFDQLKADYKEKYGKAVDCLNCEYRSMRLARTEINMAYRTAEQKRWQQFDFVIGYEIKLSGSHPVEDICDTLQGRYPKDFRFNGWHPNCMCYCVPILKTEEQFWADDNEPIENEVTDVPDAMRSWIEDNQQRIAEAEQRGTLPYWLRDNNYKGYTDSIIENPYQNATATLSVNQIERLIKHDDNIITEAIFAKECVYREDRAALHKQIVEKYIGGNDVKSEYVYMLGGAPANGKSTLVDSGLLPHPKGVLVVDPDKLKSMIPEYVRMTGSENPYLIAKAANFVHEESSMLGKMIQSECYSRDIGVVLDGVNGGSIEKVSKKIDGIRKASGKRIRADYVTLDADLSIQLAQARAKKTGRVVPESFIKKSNKNIAELIPQLIDRKVFDELYLWDTNINKNPRLILKMIDGKLDIVEPALYEKFLLKAK